MWIKKLLLILVLCPVCQAVNDFSGEGSLIGHWTFDGATPFDDASGNGNHLYRQGGPGKSPLLDTTNMRAGYSGCGDFELTNSEYLTIADADLAAGFPCKSGETNTTFSVTGWFKPEGMTGYQHMACKLNAGGGKRCWSVVLLNDRLRVMWGYNGGASVYQYEVVRTLQTGEWYFFTVTFNDAGNSCIGYLYDTTNTTWYSVVGEPASAINNEDSSFYIGKEAGGSYYDGLLQDVCIFSDVITEQEAIDIVAKTYDLEGDAALISRYKLDKEGLGWDDKETNHLLSAPIKGFAGPRDDVKCALFDGTYAACCWRADGDLSSNFPHKYGETNTAMTLLYWFKPTTLQADNEFAVSKHGQANYKSWTTGHSSANNVWVGGSATLAASSDRAVVNDQWYHCALVLDSVSPLAKIRLWDVTADTVYDSGDDTSGTIDLYNVPFMVGANSADALTAPGDDEFHGYVGELVVIGRVLSDAEIDQERAGTFAAAASSGGQLIMIQEF